MMTLPRAESVRERAAEESSRADRAQVDRDAAVPACAIDMPRRVSMTGMNVEKLIAVSVRRTTMR